MTEKYLTNEAIISGLHALRNAYENSNTSFSITFTTESANGLHISNDVGILPFLNDVIALIEEQKEIIEKYEKADTFLTVHGWKWPEKENEKTS